MFKKNCVVKHGKLFSAVHYARVTEDLGMSLAQR